MKDSDDPWKRLVEASKEASSEESSTPPPKVSVGNLRQTVQSLLLALTWRKWSLLAALLAGLAFFIFYQTQKEDTPPSGPIIQPEPPNSPIEP